MNFNLAKVKGTPIKLVFHEDILIGLFNKEKYKAEKDFNPAERKIADEYLLSQHKERITEYSKHV